LVWAVALAFEVWDPQRPQWLTVRRLVLLSGFCAGAAVALKLSNGPLAILMPLLWGIRGSTLKHRIANMVLGSLATLVGFVLLYGYWGWQLWSHYGNPMYPFYDSWFAPVRAWLDWRP
jgi:hypothetical protein